MVENFKTEDPTEARAHVMRQALADLGVSARVHWDRSPWGVAIELADLGAEHSRSYGNPTLYVLTEGTETIAGFENTWSWFGQVDGFGDDADQILSDSVISWHERHWMGHGVAEVAQAVATLVQILKHGASAPLVTTEGQ
jgi:hypothetical protein